jgi:uncharacterized membrane protein
MATGFLILAQVCVIAYALVGGVFVAFSDFLMRSLARTSGTAGVEAMQVINREVFRWVFMALFLGLAPVSLLVALYGLIAISGTTGMLFAAAGLTYCVGCFGVTVVFNVPLNERLATMDVAEEATGAFWSQTYVPRWSFWNTVRGSACIVSAALMLFGSLDMVRGAAALDAATIETGSKRAFPVCMAGPPPDPSGSAACAVGSPRKY